MSPIAFLTDYGTRDGFVAVCHAVIAGLAPRARILDVSHDVPPQDVRHGSLVLARLAPFLTEAVYLAVVDPGVGTERRAIAVRAKEGFLVGPDNGLLIPAAERLGGITAAYALTEPSWQLGTDDATFHGRDIFAPVAARLARGDDIAGAGEPVPVEDLVRLDEPRWSLDKERLTSEVRYVDGFGNLQLGPRREVLERMRGRFDVRVGGDTRGTASSGTAFGDVPEGDLVLYADSDGHLALAVNNGSATETLRIKGGDELTLVPTQDSAARGATS